MGSPDSPCRLCARCPRQGGSCWPYSLRCLQRGYACSTRLAAAVYLYTGVILTHRAQASASLSPLEALRFSQQEAEEDLVQPGRQLQEFLTSNKFQHPDLAVRQAQHDYCGKGPPPERLIIGLLTSILHYAVLD